MRARIFVLALWFATAAAFGAGILRARSALGGMAAWRATVWPAPAIVVLADSDSLATLADRIAGSDPFRTARQPSQVAYDPAHAGEPQPAAAHVGPNIPSLSVAGIVGGPPWIALVNGVPGRDGSASVRAGDTIAGTRVISIARTSVTFGMADTTWRLALQVPWPR